MATRSPNEITRLLLAWGNGDQEALRTLVPLLYEELRRLALSNIPNEDADHTPQTKALVQEAYLTLIDSSQVRWRDRMRFFALASPLMRGILIDFKRGRKSLKRGDVIHPPLDDPLKISQDHEVALEALNDALNALGQLYPRQRQVVQLRFFKGLSVEETAEALNVSPETVKRDLRLAKVWLLRELGQGGGDGAS
jgi:RNA polymerase sigma factor (TIGR02999 family)